MRRSCLSHSGRTKVAPGIRQGPGGHLRVAVERSQADQRRPNRAGTGPLKLSRTSQLRERRAGTFGSRRNPSGANPWRDKRSCILAGWTARGPSGRWARRLGLVRAAACGGGVWSKELGTLRPRLSACRGETGAAPGLRHDCRLAGGRGAALLQRGSRLAGGCAAVSPTTRNRAGSGWATRSPRGLLSRSPRGLAARLGLRWTAARR